MIAHLPKTITTFARRAIRKVVKGVRLMSIHKKPLVPDYVYSSRVKDEDIPYFERQYFRNIDLYDADVKETSERFDFAKRMGYAFFAQLKAAFERSGPEIQAAAAKAEKLGNKGYDWAYLPQFLDSNSVVYAFGVGTDISFEEALTKRHVCAVHTFDPTPQAVEYAVKIARQNPLIRFYPYGVMSRDTLIRFYKPKEAGLGSLSANNLHFGDAYIEAPVMRLGTIATQLKHKQIDLLKIDIEGGEYDVIDDMLFNGMAIDQFAVEFDQPTPPWRTTRFIAKLHGAGYHLVDVSGLNCLFVHQRIMDKLAGRTS